ncbi:hypothetical protein [Streptomyces sp. MspMP-M5]|uniref:hypothetical protein n=1 Tax=unclassified Streptomyces TaxID=2593676 RepID=UPI0003A1A55C|nr:hypothetical protein [Streptomyces sp. MspMP-M5]MYT29316.1 hypothetical protein [Streptomyces sp. SID8354]
MGIESEQLVFDYLSRVGDLAQQRGLPSGARMRLVASLRAEIDARKADQKADSVPGVKRMLARLGTPEAVVQAAADAEGGGGGPAAGPARPVAPPVEPARPAQWSGAREKFGGLIGKVPPPRDREGERDAAAEDGRRPGLLKKRGGRPPVPEAPTAGAPPHLAGADELGDGEEPPDWWRVQAGPPGAEDEVPGFVGGIEIPEIWHRPEEEAADGEQAGDGERAEGARKPGAGAAPSRKGRRVLPALVRRALGRRPEEAADAGPAVEAAGAEEAAAAPAAVPLRAWLSPVPTLAVLLLVAGAVVGSWLALAGGWALAYVSRRLSRREAKFAALGVPGIVVGGLLVWVWGRNDGRWGDPIPPGHLGTELLAGLPGVVRVAAVASALFLLWRMRRTAG